MRKSFSEIFTPAISRRNALTSLAVTMRTPSSPRYWNRRLPGNFEQHVDRAGDARAMEFLLDRLAALGAEFQRDRRAAHRDVRLEQGRGAARAVCLGVALAAGADRAARDQLDHRGKRKLARRLGARRDACSPRGGCAAALRRGAAGGAPCAARAPSPNPDDSGTAAGRPHRARSPGCAHADRRRRAPPRRPAAPRGASSRARVISSRIVRPRAETKV